MSQPAPPRAGPSPQISNRANASNRALENKDSCHILLSLVLTSALSNLLHLVVNRPQRFSLRHAPVRQRPHLLHACRRPPPARLLEVDHREEPLDAAAGGRRPPPWHPRPVDVEPSVRPAAHHRPLAAALQPVVHVAENDDGYACHVGECEAQVLVAPVSAAATAPVLAADIVPRAAEPARPVVSEHDRRRARRRSAHVFRDDRRAFLRTSHAPERAVHARVPLEARASRGEGPPADDAEGERLEVAAAPADVGRCEERVLLPHGLKLGALPKARLSTGREGGGRGGGRVECHALPGDQLGEVPRVVIAHYGRDGKGAVQFSDGAWDVGRLVVVIADKEGGVRNEGEQRGVVVLVVLAVAVADHSEAEASRRCSGCAPDTERCEHRAQAPEQPVAAALLSPRPPHREC
mmetsp:Transcript_45546/g.146628  ORF Transcript_45546/g.146628 Transcript_45546/m.146628 type:complete len:408 (+) Transcript_45546:104-1327(+)